MRPALAAEVGCPIESWDVLSYSGTQPELRPSFSEQGSCGYIPERRDILRGRERGDHDSWVARPPQRIQALFSRDMKSRP